MALDFSSSPYFDDFDPTKNFYRILYKPGFAVQARELTQGQTILQDQITKFADNIFKQNSPVTGGQVTTNLNCFYVKLNTVYNGSPINVQTFLGRLVTDSTGTIVARVIAVDAGATGGDPPTFILSYQSGTHFTDNQVIYDVLSNAAVQAVPSASTGASSVVSIAQGVFYIASNYTRADGINISNGTFVQVNPQTAILSKYTNVPSARVGLNITETIQDYIGDPSLLDPAIGASNYQAPGADRYQIILTLESRPLSLGDDDGFVELVRIENGIITKMVDGSVYGVIDDYFAKRTFETNGDYIVNDFSITPSSNTTSTLYDLNIGSGIAYVHGYRAENQSTLKLTNTRSRNTVAQNNNPVFTDYGNYFFVNSANGVFDVTTGMPVDLHTVANGSVVSTNTTTYASTLAGSGYIRGLVFDHYGSNANTASYVYKAYVYDITTNTLGSNAASGTANTITFYDTNGTFSGVANAYYGVTLTITSGTSAGDVRRIVSYASHVATVDTPFSFTPDTTSQFVLHFGTKDVETIANTASGTTNLAAWANIDNEGKVGGVPTGDAIYENSSAPELVFQIGQPYISTLGGGFYNSTEVFRNKAFSGGSLSVTLPVSLQGVVSFEGGTGTLSADSVKQNYTIICVSTGDVANNGNPGSIMDWSTSGNTIAISGTHSEILTLTSTKYKAPLTVTVIAKMNVLNADNNQHILKLKTLVSGNTAVIANTGPDGIIASNTYVDLTNGQVYIKNAAIVGVGVHQSLYVSDVKDIVQIIDTKSSSAGPTLAMLSDPTYDVTSNYTFNNGQKDSHYDHAFLTLNPGAPVPQGNLLVIFDFYKHTGGDGYFSLMSYVNELYTQIPTFTSSGGNFYQLRDCIDFRPTRVNGTATFAFDYSASPSTNDTGTYLPQDLTNFTSNYAYYLARKDLLVLNKDKNFLVVQGNPSVNPAFPAAPDGSLILAKLSHDPYTAFIPSEAPKGVVPNLSVEKVQHRRWTMSDISDLQTRINNIEYYTSLNTLEQNTQGLQVPDANGLNRFKNGILVDDFSSYGTADTSNPDFSVAIDRLNRTMSAAQTVSNYPLHSVAVVSTMNRSATSPSTLGFQINTVNKATNYFTLPYTTANVVVQQLASNTVSVNPFSNPVFQGIVELNPPMDNWVDNSKAPDTVITDPNLQVQQTANNSLSVLNVGNWQSVPGTQPIVKPITAAALINTVAGLAGVGGGQTTRNVSIKLF